MLNMSVENISSHILYLGSLTGKESKSHIPEARTDVDAGRRLRNWEASESQVSAIPDGKAQERRAQPGKSWNCGSAISGARD